MKRKNFTLVSALGMFALTAGAWDYEGHHVVNELALASLPKEFGGFELTPALKNRIAFLAGEPDRWRKAIDLPLKHYNGSDHYFDLEDITLCGLTPEKAGHLLGEGGKELEGRPFLDGQLVKGGQMLGNIWLTAWLEAPTDTYLQKQLQQRNADAPR